MSDDADPEVPAIPDAVEGLPPSTRHVYTALRDWGPLSTGELAQYTGIAPANLSRHIAHLKHADVVEEEYINAKQKEFDVLDSRVSDADVSQSD